MKNLITLFFLALISWNVDAAHIIGGSTDYDILSIDGDVVTVKFTFALYRDANSSGAQFDTPAEFGIYGLKDAGGFGEIKMSVYEYPSSISPINIENQFCANEALINYEKAFYSFTIDIKLEEKYESYMVSYQRCCRNTNIININDPAETGMALFVEVSRQGMLDLTPAAPANNNFPAVVKSGKSTEFDMSIPDGFIKEYELIKAHIGGGIDGVSGGDENSCTGILPSAQNCPPPFAQASYKSENLFGEQAQVILDKETGQLQLEIPQLGPHVVAISTKRHKDGEWISTMNQQFIIQSIICTDTDDLEKEAVMAYPNPTNGTLFIHERIKNIQLFSQDGQRHNISQHEIENHTVDISEYANGIYILKGELHTGELFVKKIIKL